MVRHIQRISDQIHIGLHTRKTLCKSIVQGAIVLIIVVGVGIAQGRNGCQCWQVKGCHGLRPGYFKITGEIRVEFVLIRTDFGTNKPFIPPQSITYCSGIISLDVDFFEHLALGSSFQHADELNLVLDAWLGFDAKSNGLAGLRQIFNFHSRSGIKLPGLHGLHNRSTVQRISAHHHPAPPGICIFESKKEIIVAIVRSQAVHQGLPDLDVM